MAHTEGSGKNLWVAMLLVFMSIGISGSQMPNHFTADELEMLFGPNGCIEGVLTLMPTPQSGNPVLAAIPGTQQIVKPASGLMGPEGNGLQQDIANITVNTATKSPMVSLTNFTNINEKTPINLVNELVKFNKIQHQYQLTNEQGPAHEKRFTVVLKLGEEEYTAEGVSIKKAQHLAASEALEHTQYMHPSPKTTRSVHLGKSSCLEIDPNAENKSPISLVYELAAKRNLPLNFEVENEEGPPHMRTFVTKCTVGDKVSTGEGNSKKESKKRAAEKMLEELKNLSPSSGSPCLKRKAKKKTNKKKSRKIRNLIKLFQMPTGGSSGHHVFPGFLWSSVMFDGAATNEYGQSTPSKNSGRNPQTTTTIEKGVLNGDSLPSAEASAKSRMNNKASSPTGRLKTSPHSQAVRPKDQLLNVAQLLGFEVQFSDFPQGKNNMFLSLVSLSTDIPHVCYGTGSTTDASHDQASLTALRALSKMRLGSDAPPGAKMKSESGSQSDSLDLSQPDIREMESITLFK